MKWITVPGVLAWVVASGVTAEAQPMTGCWHYSDGSVFSSVCLTGPSGGTFNLEYATQDPEQGLVKGSCNAVVEVTSMNDDSVVFSVPYQEGACRQEDQVFRVARRDYACQRGDNPRQMICNLIVYYDDGTIYSESAGLAYNR